MINDVDWQQLNMTRKEADKEKVFKKRTAMGCPVCRDWMYRVIHIPTNLDIFGCSRCAMAISNNTNKQKQLSRY